GRKEEMIVYDVEDEIESNPDYVKQNATVFGIPKEPVLETAELITSRLTGAGSLLPPVYGEAWAKGHATGTPDSTFPRPNYKSKPFSSPTGTDKNFHRNRSSRLGGVE
ncbi:hypothetical protein TNCV_3903731, partial [Trichonephila clavipes]